MNEKRRWFRRLKELGLKACLSWFSPDDYEHVRRAAEMENLPVAAFVRLAAITAARLMISGEFGGRDHAPGS